MGFLSLPAKPHKHLRLRKESFAFFVSLRADKVGVAIHKSPFHRGFSGFATFANIRDFTRQGFSPCLFLCLKFNLKFKIL